MARKPEYDISGLDQEVLDGLEDGRYKISGPGQKANKPVVISAETGRMVKGTGRPLRANDPAEVGRRTGFKRSKAYNEHLEALIPASREDSDIALSSLDELTDRALELVNGFQTTASFKCEKCDHPNRVEIRKPPDQKMITWLLARLTGEPTKTAEVNVRSEELVAILHDYTPGEVRSVGLDAAEVERRRRLIVDGDVIE